MCCKIKIKGSDYLILIRKLSVSDFIYYNSHEYGTECDAE